MVVELPSLSESSSPSRWSILSEWVQLLNRRRKVSYYCCSYFGHASVSVGISLFLSPEISIIITGRKNIDAQVSGLMYIWIAQLCVHFGVPLMPIPFPGALDVFPDPARRASCPTSQYRVPLSLQQVNTAPLLPYFLNRDTTSDPLTFEISIFRLHDLYW